MSMSSMSMLRCMCSACGLRQSLRAPLGLILAHGHAPRITPCITRQLIALPLALLAHYGPPSNLEDLRSRRIAAATAGLIRQNAGRRACGLVAALLQNRSKEEQRNRCNGSDSCCNNHRRPQGLILRIRHPQCVRSERQRLRGRGGRPPCSRARAR